MAFDLEKEEAKYREERASRFTNNTAKPEPVVDENGDKTTQIIGEPEERPFRETFMWSAFFWRPDYQLFDSSSRNKALGEVLFLGGFRYLYCSSNDC